MGNLPPAYPAQSMRPGQAFAGQSGTPVMIAPALIVSFLFFFLPLGFVALNSLTVPKAGGLVFTLDNFGKALTDEFYLEVMLRTLRIGVLTTLATFAIGYPAALYLYFSRSIWRRVFLLIVVSPLFVSVIVRTYGWIVVLSPNGALNALLPDGYKVRLLQTDTAIILGLMHIYVPFMVLSINAAVNKIDKRLITAAQTLGASNWRIFRDVLLPLSRPGIITGCVIVFSISMTAFSTPVLLGGTRNKTMPYLIYQTNLQIADWHLGSALAFVLLLVTLIAVQAVSLLLRTPKEGPR